MCISSEDIMVIFRVMERFDVHEISQINILDIIISFNRLKPFHDDVYKMMLIKYHKVDKLKEDSKKLFYFVINQIRHIVSFESFNWILRDSGHRKFSKCIYAEKNGTLIKSPSKRELPHVDIVNEYFSNLKRCADNNALQDGTRYRLECFIDQLDEKLRQCNRCSGRFQLLIDKRVMVYFLLAQQFSDMDKRLGILKRMRDSMSQDVDRSLFDTIYHSYMIVIWSIKDNPEMAERHEEQARHACQLCVPGLASIILRLCAQYKDNIFYSRRHNSADLEHATTNFEEVFEMFDFVKDDPKIYGVIAMLEMVHTLLGIDWDLSVCDIKKIDPINIEKSRDILSSLTKPFETRRQMLYFLCKARTHECHDLREAQKFARKSLDLAGDGSYYESEKRNIKNYLDALSAKVNNLPQPEI